MNPVSIRKSLLIAELETLMRRKHLKLPTLDKTSSFPPCPQHTLNVYFYFEGLTGRLIVLRGKAIFEPVILCILIRIVLVLLYFGLFTCALYLFNYVIVSVTHIMCVCV